MYDFLFADIGEGIHEGQILKWNFKVGDMVKEGETLCIVETDKVNAEIPSPVAGKITKLGAEVGETIHVGETLAMIDDGSSTTEEAPKETPKEETKETPKKEGVSEGPKAGVVGEIEDGDDVIESTPEDEEEATSNEKKLASPLARKVAADLGVDLAKIKGTGEQGRVLKEDILAFAKNSTSSTPSKSPSAQPRQAVSIPQSDRTTREKISKVRKTIVKNMSLSKQIIPHTVLMDEFDISALVHFRNEQKEAAASRGVKLTYMAFILKAITLALEEFPIFNASFDEQTEEIVYKHDINVGIAVDTKEGLMVPNIKNANTKGIMKLAEEIELLANKAKDRSITLDEMQNGTFTITNYGAFDSTYGTPIIKHPELAIIGIGKISKKPIVKDDQIVVGNVLPISLAVDHRIIDGADAGRFIIKFKEYLRDPMLLLLS